MSSKSSPGTPNTENEQTPLRLCRVLVPILRVGACLCSKGATVRLKPTVAQAASAAGEIEIIGWAN